MKVKLKLKIALVLATIVLATSFWHIVSLYWKQREIEQERFVGATCVKEPKYKSTLNRISCVDESVAQRAAPAEWMGTCTNWTRFLSEFTIPSGYTPIRRCNIHETGNVVIGNSLGLIKIIAINAPVTAVAMRSDVYYDKSLKQMQAIQAELLPWREQRSFSEATVFQIQKATPEDVRRINRSFNSRINIVAGFLMSFVFDNTKYYFSLDKNHLSDFPNPFAKVTRDVASSAIYLLDTPGLSRSQNTSLMSHFDKFSLTQPVPFSRAKNPDGKKIVYILNIRSNKIAFDAGFLGTGRAGVRRTQNVFANDSHLFFFRSPRSS